MEGSGEVNVLWAITGAGHWLKESVELIINLRKRANVTVVVSKAGMEVLRIYGLKGRLRDEGYYNELFEDRPDLPIFGRLCLRRYKVLVVAPMTANTMIKAALGIADNAVTTSIAMARKCEVPVIVLPTDAPWVKETTIPCVVESCVGCSSCPPLEVCPTSAISIVSGKARIDITKCIGCELCVSRCPYEAVSCWKRVPFKPHGLELEYLKKLDTLGFTVAKDPSDLEGKIREVLKL